MCYKLEIATIPRIVLERRALYIHVNSESISFIIKISLLLMKCYLRNILLNIFYTCCLCNALLSQYLLLHHVHYIFTLIDTNTKIFLLVTFIENAERLNLHLKCNYDTPLSPECHFGRHKIEIKNHLQSFPPGISAEQSEQ